MTPIASVTDLASYRKRRQAQLMAQAMWALYASRFGQPVMPLHMLPMDTACRS